MNLVVQLWGIGNLIQTEPLLRELRKGDILVDPLRSTAELSLLFPNWKFITADYLQGISDHRYDDVYLCYPMDGRQFAPVANRIHVPTWSFKKWESSESQVLLEMTHSAHWPGVPQIKIPGSVDGRGKHIAMSIGYLKNEEGWGFKHWGNENFTWAIDLLIREGYTPVIFGSAIDWDTDGRIIAEQVKGESWEEVTELPLWGQVKYLAGCDAYLGNDTGMGHVAGALGLPSAIYTVTDRVKNQTAAPHLLQFGREVKPPEAVSWLVEVLEDGKAHKIKSKEDAKRRPRKG